MTTRYRSKLIPIALSAALLAGGAPYAHAAAAASSSGAASAASADANVVLKFADPNFEKTVREAIGKPSGVLHKSDVANLYALTIYSNRNIVSLEGIQQLDKLNNFAIYDNPVTDLAPLTKVKSLKSLALSKLLDSNYKTVVPRLTGLSALSLYNFGFGELSFLKPLTKLTSLNFSGNQAQDISVVAGMTKLTWLNGSNNKISDLSPIAGLPLRALYMSSNRISNLSPVDALQSKSQVYAIQLEYNQITDVATLAKFPNLSTLCLNGNPAASLLPVYPMISKLVTKDFTLSYTDRATTVRFSDPGLEKAVREAISKPSGDLTYGDISGIQTLNASAHAIRDLSGIQYLPQLAAVDFSGNAIKDLAPLQDLTQLRSLKLKGNPANNFAAIRDVVRGLTAKDFDPGFKFQPDVKAATFEELVQAAETMIDQPDKKVTITITNPALQNETTYYDMYSYLFAKYPTSYGTFKYVSPTEVRDEKLKFKIYVQSPAYTSFYGTATFEAASRKFNVAQYEKPSANDNMKAESDVQSQDADIVALAQQLVSGKTTGRDKLLAIHDWVADNIRYDYDTLNGYKSEPQDAVSVLRSKIGVCQGYANLTAALGRAAGIPVQVVIGHIANFGGTWDMVLKRLFTRSYSHAWNQAYADGKWVVLDTTWDAAQYVDGNKISDAVRSYFDPDPVIFASSHTFYAPNPKPDGLKDYYFALTDADRSAANKIAWSNLWENEGSVGTFTTYNAAGHMLNGKATAVQAYRVPDGSFRVYTLARNKSGTWEIVSKEKRDSFLAPTGGFKLDSY